MEQSGRRGTATEVEPCRFAFAALREETAPFEAHCPCDLRVIIMPVVCAQGNGIVSVYACSRLFASFSVLRLTGVQDYSAAPEFHFARSLQKGHYPGAVALGLCSGDLSLSHPLERAAGACAGPTHSVAWS